MICREAIRYFSIAGRSISSSGHLRIASADDIAECTPKRRAS
jgi:hypothetical protein